MGERRETMPYGNKKAPIDANTSREKGNIKLRDGSTLRIKRAQSINQEDGILYGTLQAYKKITGGEMLVGELGYSFPGYENARIDRLVVKEDQQLIGVGSAMLGFFLEDSLLHQKRKHVVATSGYDPLFARFMEDNGFTVYPNRHDRTINYSIYYKDKAKMFNLIERQDDLARVADYEARDYDM